MKPIILFILAMMACSSVCAAPFVLVTDEEAALEASTPAPKVSMSRAFVSPDMPRIKVLSPDLVKDVFTAPLPIELKFTSAGDAEIDPASFKASYGFMRIDITKRITQSVKVSKSGFSIAEAAIPKGSHRLLLQVADTKGRVGETDLRFTVE